MSDDPNSPEALLSVPTEVEAALIVNLLGERGIKAFALGGYTSGFRTSTPGSVTVVVRQAEFAQAQRAWAEIEEERGSTDSSPGDIGETETDAAESSTSDEDDEPDERCPE